VTLYVHPDNPFWRLRPDGAEIVPVRKDADLIACLPGTGALVFAHTKLGEPLATELARRHRLVGFAHLPLHQRQPDWLQQCALVVTVSQYCIGLLKGAGVERLYPEPLYGAADLARGDAQAAVKAASPYIWDRRKARDRLLGSMQPLFGLAREAEYAKRPGLTLGIVSLIVPIKQFPLLFSHLAPVLARHAVNVEIFGAGGYAQVRDLKKAIAPIAAKVRFWGYQENVAAVYPGIDYLLTGLPEKEALGLNVLEAQLCGTPVLAPRGGPFVETVLDGATGFLYRDPREDGAADFTRLLDSIRNKPKLDPRGASAHLERFAYPAFAARVRRLLEAIPQA